LTFIFINMIYNYPTTKETFVSDYVQVACMGTLTKIEQKIISTLIRLYLEVEKSNNPWTFVFTANSYTKAFEESGLSKKTNFYKVISNLKAKKVIKEDNTITRILIPQEDAQFGIQFVLK
jgi:hypothetical protein